jgi:formate dehydrogenase iron-sulfur subunit
MAKSMLIDASICVGCKGCQVACKEWNDLPALSTKNTGSYQNPPDLSSKAWVVVKFFEHQEGSQVQWLFLPTRCMHCSNAPCVSVCPTGAMHREQNNYVVVNTDWCIGCRYCVQACPYGVAKFEPDTGWVRKCHFCIDRVVNDLPPACAKTCPAGAIAFGDRAQMIAKGKERVGVLKARGNAKANLYGETQLGGLNTLYVLPQPPAVYGLPEQPLLPEVKLTLDWASGAIAAGVLSTIPLWWVIKRRIENAGTSPSPAEGGEQK